MQLNKDLIKTLPNCGYNRGRVVPLVCSCPSDCSCNAQQPKNWQHKKCGNPSFINEFGDIFCKNFKDSEDCDGYFIQHAKFQCADAKNGQTWQQFKSAKQFWMALAQGMQAADCFYLNDDDLVQFGNTLHEQVHIRWTH